MYRGDKVALAVKRKILMRLSTKCVSHHIYEVYEDTFTVY